MGKLAIPPVDPPSQIVPYLPLKTPKSRDGYGSPKVGGEVHVGLCKRSDHARRFRKNFYPPTRDADWPIIPSQSEWLDEEVLTSRLGVAT